jgi:LAS superfamily LD-carboxypeptidase LdcB
VSALLPQLARGLAFLQAVARANGHGLVVTSTRRSRTQQRRLYADYLAGKSKYPAAPPGSSAHELGRAFDAVIEPRAWQDTYGALWERMGGRWGGRFGDPVHFEV